MRGRHWRRSEVVEREEGNITGKRYEVRENREEKQEGSEREKGNGKD